MFHGFIFTYRLPPTKEKTESEIGEIEKMLSNARIKKKERKMINSKKEEKTVGSQQLS